MMNHEKAIGFLVAGAVNALLNQEDDDHFGNGCCVIHCGTCAALLWLKENDPDYIDMCLRELRDDESVYDWQYPDGGLDWIFVEQRWDSWKGCVVSNGVFKPCTESEGEMAISFNPKNGFHIEVSSNG